jgi:hypothetical protein
MEVVPLRALDGPIIALGQILIDAMRSVHYKNDAICF